MTENKTADLLFYKYAGSVYQSLTRYRFKYKDENNNIMMNFSTKKYGSLEKARIAAETFQENFSDENDLTTLVFACDGNIQVRKYLIGFSEGDGCIHINKTGTVIVSVAQAQTLGVPKVLLLFQSVYGGYVDGPRKGCSEKSRQVYSWKCNGFAALPILKDWIQFGVLKRDQSKLVFDFMTQNNTSNCKPLWAQLHAAKAPEKYKEIEIDDSILTIYYLAGIFDAEGCITCRCDAGVEVTIAQQNSPKLLYSLKKLCDGLGTANDTVLRFTGNSTERVLREMLPYLIVKAPQALVALEIRKLALPQGKKHIKEDLIKLVNLRANLKALKKT